MNTKLTVTAEEFRHLEEFRKDLIKVVALINAGQLDHEVLDEPMQALDAAWAALPPQVKDYIEVNLKAQQEAGQ